MTKVAEDFVGSGPEGEGLDWFLASDGCMELRPAKGTKDTAWKRERAKKLTRYYLAVQHLAKEPGAMIRRSLAWKYQALWGNTGPLVVCIPELPAWFIEEMQACNLSVQYKGEHAQAVYEVPFEFPEYFVGLRYV